MKQVEQNLRGSSSQGQVVMEITTPNWQRKLQLEFHLSGDNQALVKVLAPVKEAGMATLRLGGNMWQYLPKVERTIKIPISMMSQSWMGSDFTNDDMMKATSLVRDYTHRLLATETTGQFQVWKIESKPKPDVPVVWGKLVFWIGEDFLPRKQEFYDERGELVRVLEFTDFRELAGRKFPAVWKMASVRKTGCFTRLNYLSLVFDQAIPDTLFSLQNLKK